MRISRIAICIHRTLSEKPPELFIQLLLCLIKSYEVHSKNTKASQAIHFPPTFSFYTFLYHSFGLLSGALSVFMSQYLLY